jgi:hypothetical protein
MKLRRPKLGGRYIAWARGAFTGTVSMPKEKRPNRSNQMATNELLGPSWPKTPARSAMAQLRQRQA